MDIRGVFKKIGSKWRVLLIILVPVVMLYALAVLVLPSPGHTNKGRADFSGVDFSNNKLISLDGQWEFYWNRFIRSENFTSGQKLKMDSFIKVPGIWSDKKAGNGYKRQGFASYRLVLLCPPSIKDPALRIQNVATAYRLYANGKLLAEVGNASDKRLDFKEGEETQIVDLPKDTREVELIFQVANLNYATGGLRASPVFGSKQVLSQQKMIVLVLQLLFIGSVFIFGLHYFLLFLLQTKNKTALFFSLLCFITVLRSLIWGETPILILFQNVSFNIRMYINYFTGYNYVLVVILFINSLYPLDFKKKATGMILLPALVFDGFLLFTSPEFMSAFTNILYLILVLQMIYVIGILMKSVLLKRDNSVLLFIAICVLVYTVNEDILNYKGIGSIRFSCMFLLGNFAVIMAMSYVQARQQAINHKRLILYNESLIEADRLKDKIMATEMSFLQAQIKPHFLYNALSAIANVCEKDGKIAGKLIIDLAIYLRGSLEFNNLDKMVTIEKELEFVDTYFNIEQARFGQKIQLKKEIEIPLDIQIPVLILQPLVENAVRHGISKKPGGGTVTVKMKQAAENIYIEIEDDGIGISSEKLPELLTGSDLTQGVGLLNIHNRLLKLYGRGLEITSEPGRTCANLVIPEVV